MKPGPQVPLILHSLPKLQVSPHLSRRFLFQPIVLALSSGVSSSFPISNALSCLFLPERNAASWTGLRYALWNMNHCFHPDSCLDRICGPYEQCVEDAGGVASCVCQECDGGAEDEERVCGSDGITYFSLCHLQRASCTQGQEDIEALHQGPCGMCCSTYIQIEMGARGFCDRLDIRWW